MNEHHAHQQANALQRAQDGQAGEIVAAPFSFADMEGMASAIVRGGLFPQFKSPEQALSLMLLCQAKGLHPMVAVERYDVIQGRPAMKTTYLLAEFKSRGGRVQWQDLPSDEQVGGKFIAPNGDCIEVVWTKERAMKAKLWTKDTWQQYPQQMMRARCAAEAIRAIAPECLHGLYTVEEVRDMPPLPPINVTPAPAPRPALASAFPASDVPVTVSRDRSEGRAAAGLGSDERGDRHVPAPKTSPAGLPAAAGPVRRPAAPPAAPTLHSSSYAPNLSQARARFRAAALPCGYELPNPPAVDSLVRELSGAANGPLTVDDFERAQDLLQDPGYPTEDMSQPLGDPESDAHLASVAATSVTVRGDRSSGDRNVAGAVDADDTKEDPFAR